MAVVALVDTVRAVSSHVALLVADATLARKFTRLGWFGTVGLVLVVPVRWSSVAVRGMIRNLRDLLDPVCVLGVRCGQSEVRSEQDLRS
jgi:hypothetical protein